MNPSDFEDFVHGSEMFVEEGEHDTYTDSSLYSPDTTHTDTPPRDEPTRDNQSQHVLNTPSKHVLNTPSKHVERLENDGYSNDKKSDDDESSDSEVVLKEQDEYIDACIEVALSGAYKIVESSATQAQKTMAKMCVDFAKKAMDAAKCIAGGQTDFTHAVDMFKDFTDTLSKLNDKFPAKTPTQILSEEVPGGVLKIGNGLKKKMCYVQRTCDRRAAEDELDIPSLLQTKSVVFRARRFDTDDDPRDTVAYVSYIPHPAVIKSAAEDIQKNRGVVREVRVCVTPATNMSYRRDLVASMLTAAIPYTSRAPHRELYIGGLVYTQ